MVLYSHVLQQSLLWYWLSFFSLYLGRYVLHLVSKFLLVSIMLFKGLGFVAVSLSFLNACACTSVLENSWLLLLEILLLLFFTPPHVPMESKYVSTFDIYPELLIPPSLSPLLLFCLHCILGRSFWPVNKFSGFLVLFFLLSWIKLDELIQYIGYFYVSIAMFLVSEFLFSSFSQFPHTCFTISLLLQVPMEPRK